MSNLKQLIQHIVSSLVENQSAVRVSQVEKGGAQVIAISVDKSDVGRIIGKEGQTIKAIRALAFSVMTDQSISDIVIDES